MESNASDPTSCSPPSLLVYSLHLRSLILALKFEFDEIRGLLTGAETGWFAGGAGGRGGGRGGGGR